MQSFERAEKSGDENKIIDVLKILRKITCIPKIEIVFQEIVLSKVMTYLDMYLDYGFVAQDLIQKEILWIYINLTSLSQKKNTLLDFSSIISKIMSKLTHTTSDQSKIEMVNLYK